MKLIQRRRLGLPIPDPFDVAWEFSKGEMSLEKSLFDWFDPAVERNVPMQMPLHEPRKIPSPKPRHDAALENIRTNATREVKPQKLLDDGISAMPLLGTGHEEHTPDPNAHHEPGWVEHDTKTIEEVQQDVAEEEWMEEERAAIRRILEGDFSDFETETKDNVVADMPFVAELPDANLSDIEPEVVMPDEERTSLEQKIQDSINVAEQVGFGQNKKPIKTFSNNKTIGDILNEGAIDAYTPSDVIEFLHEMVEDDQRRSHTRAKQIFYNNQNDLVEHHGYDEYDEVFEKGIQTIVENPFANPFYDMSAFSIKKERPKGFVAPPAFTPPIDLIKQEQPNAIEGFETNEGDDLSLLPSSVFKNTDAPVVDNMSLLPTGWKNE